MALSAPSRNRSGRGQTLLLSSSNFNSPVGDNPYYFIGRGGRKVANYFKQMNTHETSGHKRFYVDALTVPNVTITGDQAHHGLNVLRLTPGAPVTVFDGQGRKADGTVSATVRGQMTVSLEAIGDARPRPQPEIELAFAVPKGKRVDWLLEKASELGVATLQPVVFERSVAGGPDLGQAKRQRWMGHCISAARQCGLDFLPVLKEPLTLSAYLLACRADVRLVGEVDLTGRSMLEVLADWQPGWPVALLIGPEGDLTAQERTASHAAGFRAAHLGQTVLRVETAAVALTAAIVASCDHLNA